MFGTCHERDFSAHSARPVTAGTRNAQFKVRVVDIPPGTSAETLKTAFDAFGPLEAELAGGNGGMGFVSFPSQEQLDNAVKTGAVRALASRSSCCARTCCRCRCHLTALLCTCAVDRGGRGKQEANSVSPEIGQPHSGLCTQQPRLCAGRRSWRPQHAWRPQHTWRPQHAWRWRQQSARSRRQRRLAARRWPASTAARGPARCAAACARAVRGRARSLQVGRSAV